VREKKHGEEIWWEDMDWIDLAQDRDKWQALVNHGNRILAFIICEVFLD